MIEPEMYAFTVSQLAIVTVNKPLDELPLWMARETIAVETKSGVGSEGRFCQLLIDSTEDPRWATGLTLRMDHVADDAKNFSFGSGRRQIHVYPDAGPNKDTSFVIVGKPGAFGPRFGGTL